MIKQYAPLAMALVLAACGGGKGASNNTSSTNTDSQQNSETNGQNTAGSGVEGSLLASDPNAASQIVASQADTAITAAATENQASASVALNLTSGLIDGTFSNDRSRTCEVSGQDADVEVMQDIKRDYTLKGVVRTMTNNFESYYDEKRVWSKAGGSVACDSNGKFADISVPELSGVSLAQTTTEQRKREISLSNSKSGKSWTQSSDVEISGTRDITWDSVAENSGDYVLQKTVNHTMSETISITKKDGTSQSLSAGVATSAKAPLKIQVVRNQSSLEIVSRTIQSGEVDATFKDGSTVSTVFNNVVYQASATSQCVPTSGTITGTITPAAPSGQTATAMTYTITFGDAPTIAFNNGQSADYVQDGCAFEENAAAAVDVSSSSISKPTPPAAPTDGSVSAPAAPSGSKS